MSRQLQSQIIIIINNEKLLGFDEKTKKNCMFFSAKPRETEKKILNPHK